MTHDHWRYHRSMQTTNAATNNNMEFSAPVGEWCSGWEVGREKPEYAFVADQTKDMKEISTKALVASCIPAPPPPNFLLKSEIQNPQNNRKKETCPRGPVVDMQSYLHAATCGTSVLRNDGITCKGMVFKLQIAKGPKQKKNQRHRNMKKKSRTVMQFDHFVGVLPTINRKKSTKEHLGGGCLTCLLKQISREIGGPPPKWGGMCWN